MLRRNRVRVNQDDRQPQARPPFHCFLELVKEWSRRVPPQQPQIIESNTQEIGVPRGQPGIPSEACFDSMDRRVRRVRAQVDTGDREAAEQPVQEMPIHPVEQRRR
jgi:hypothetical protein